MNLQIVLATGLVVALLYIAVVIDLFLVRFRNAVRKRHQERIERRWLPIFAAASEQVPEHIPPVPARDLRAFMILWNQLQESFVGDMKQRLNQIARLAGIDAAATQMLQKSALRGRLLAVSTLGHLADRGTWDALVNLTGHADGRLSMAAARSLTRIDATAALPVILPCVAARTDWSRNYVLSMFSELGADIVSKPLTEAALKVPEGRAHRLVQYFSVAHVADVVPVVRAIIARTDNVDCVAACLRVFADVEELDTVRGCLGHPSWQVRVQAVNVLGRLGSTEDYDALLPLLSDSEWWVRYRTAKALCSLPGIELSRIKALVAGHADAFARDILTHVLAEVHG